MSKARIYRDSNSERFGMPSLDMGRSASGETEPAAPAPDKIGREAFEKGFAAGEKAAIEIGERKIAVLLERLEAVIREMELRRTKALSELEPQVLDLCSEIAQRIVTEELSLRPEAMIKIVKEAMRKLERTGPITIKLHPSVHELFLSLKPELLDAHTEVIFDIDPALPPEGQVVIGTAEEIVTDIESQVKNIMEDIGRASGAH